MLRFRLFEAIAGQAAYAAFRRSMNRPAAAIRKLRGPGTGTWPPPLLEPPPLEAKPPLELELPPLLVVTVPPLLLMTVPPLLLLPVVTVPPLLLVLEVWVVNELLF